VFRVLGPVEAERAGACVQLGPPKQRAFLLIPLWALGKGGWKRRNVKVAAPRQL